MHVEHLDWLANNPRYTQRFATHVGRLCRDMPNKAVAETEHLHQGSVKELDKLYMREQVERAGLPTPRAIGIDEISHRQHHRSCTSPQISVPQTCPKLTLRLILKNIESIKALIINNLNGADGRI